MTLDRERMVDKTGYITEQVTALRKLMGQGDDRTVLNDAWVLRGVKYSLQTAIEACIDLAYHVCTKAFGHAPRDARDAMRRLAEAGVISGEDLNKYSAMIDLRNRMVRGYQDVSTEQISWIIAEDLDDLLRFSDRVLRRVSG